MISSILLNGPYKIGQNSNKKIKVNDTILSVEKKQRGMTWNMFLALLYIFTANEKTVPLVDLFEIRTDELVEAMQGKKK